MAPTALVQKSLEGHVGSEKEKCQNQCHPHWLSPPEKFSSGVRNWEDGLLVGIYLAQQTSQPNRNHQKRRHAKPRAAELPPNSRLFVAPRSEVLQEQMAGGRHPKHQTFPSLVGLPLELDGIGQFRILQGLLAFPGRWRT